MIAEQKDLLNEYFEEQRRTVIQKARPSIKHKSPRVKNRNN